MHKSHHEPPDTSLGFEQSDLSFSGIKWGVIGYFAFTFAVGAVVFFGMVLLGVSKPTQSERRLPPSPNPLLQNNITARTDIWNLRSREDFLLNNPSWVDQKHGVVRIPIDEAISKAAATGPAGLSTAPTGPEEAKPEPGNGIPSVPVTTNAQGMAPNSMAGTELSSTGNPPSGPGARRISVPEGAKRKP